MVCLGVASSRFAWGACKRSSELKFLAEATESMTITAEQEQNLVLIFGGFGLAIVALIVIYLFRKAK